MLNLAFFNGNGISPIVHIFGLPLAIMIGFVIGLCLWFLIRKIFNYKLQIIEAKLILHFYGDSRQPEKKDIMNVWRYYYLTNTYSFVHKVTDEVMTRNTTNLFIIFDKPLDILGNVKINPIVFQLPRHEVKYFSNRGLIIFFNGEIPAGELQILIKLN